MNDASPRWLDDAILIDAAKARAARLRAEAVDDFWRGADAALLRTVRAANRLAHRLSRRRSPRPAAAR